DRAVALKALRERLGPDPQKMAAQLLPAMQCLQQVLLGGQSAVKKLYEPPLEISATADNKSADLNVGIATGSSLSEDFLLEYTDGMRDSDLGWGRLTKENLLQIMEIHKVYAELTRRTPYIARARGSNLLAHVLRSMEQAASGKPIAGALDPLGNRV